VYQKNIEFEVFKLVWVIIETDYLLEIRFSSARQRSTADEFCELSLPNVNKTQQRCFCVREGLSTPFAIPAKHRIDPRESVSCKNIIGFIF
jgi:hypothetical protein